MAHLKAWAEHVWTRLRRMDYWDHGVLPTNAAAKTYRWVAPGSQPPARLQLTREC